MTGRYAYMFFMLLALAVFLAVRALVPKPAGLRVLPWWKRAGLGLAAFIGGALGAKLPFAVGSPEGWWTGAAWFSDGKTIVAGLCGAYLAVEVAKLLLDVRVKTGDTFALPLALAMVVGRLGCFCNGCCYGQPTDLPWGVSFLQLHQPAIFPSVVASAVGQGGGAPVLWQPGWAAEAGVNVPAPVWRVCHPTQLYECGFHFLMALVLFELLRRRLLPGQHLKLYLLCYGVYRFLTEYIRPEPVYALGLTFYQWAALVLAGSMVVLWALDVLVHLRPAGRLAVSTPRP
jgi:phosphatidylglycerol:prolipoprotein diacylglycerol transferase